MASNNIKVLFWIQPSKCNKHGEAPIYLRITYNSDRKNISTGYSISPERWDNTKGQVRGSKEDATAINGYISHTRTKLMELFNEMVNDGDVSIDGLIDRLIGREVISRTLLELVKFHNQDFQNRIGVDYTFSTFEKYDILRKKLIEFIPAKYGKKDVRLRDLNQQFMGDFDFYLKTVDGNQHNTAVKYLKNLKKVLNVAVINGWIESNPFQHFKASYKEVDRVYLTQHELDVIERKKFQISRLILVKDAFLFQCYTGLAYSDMAKLTRGHVAPGIDGNKWIIIRRTKTNVRASIPLLKQAEELIKKYDDGSHDPDRPLFPFYSIQKFNSFLHEIAELCGISKSLTSHVGRRTFATTIALANGLSTTNWSNLVLLIWTAFINSMAVI
jgi:integrase